jgi:hypothetical protein
MGDRRKRRCEVLYLIGWTMPSWGPRLSVQLRATGAARHLGHGRRHG